MERVGRSAHTKSSSWCFQSLVTGSCCCFCFHLTRSLFSIAFNSTFPLFVFNSFYFLCNARGDGFRWMHKRNQNAVLDSRNVSTWLQSVFVRVSFQMHRDRSFFLIKASDREMRDVYWKIFLEMRAWRTQLLTFEIIVISLFTTSIYRFAVQVYFELWWHFCAIRERPQGSILLCNKMKAEMFSYRKLNDWNVLAQNKALMTQLGCI